jgi:hypothetical protein
MSTIYGEGFIADLEVDGLTREQVGLALDAARYKWLRDSMESPIVSEGQATDKMVDAGISREAAMGGVK